MNDEARYLQKLIKSSRVDVHPREQAIVVHYDMRATVLAEGGDPLRHEQKEMQKMYAKGKDQSTSNFETFLSHKPKCH